MGKYTIFEIDGKFYACEYDNLTGNVYSIGNDNPKDGRRWTARATDDGIKYVASPCNTKSAAKNRIYRQRKRDKEF